MSKILLKEFSREEYHLLWKDYVPDPIMDSQSYQYNYDDVENNYNNMIKNQSWYMRVGIFLLNGYPIGEISFKRINYEKSQCELGIMIANDSYKSQGYGSEAIGLAIDYVFKVLKLRKIIVDTSNSNLRMQRILKKYGFELIQIDKQEKRLNYILINKQENPLNY
jgi:RimJ/RimL family protein N-acetyltransferase